MPTVFIDLNGASSGVRSDGNYYNALGVDISDAVSNARDSTDTSNTGWTVTVTNAFNLGGSTGSSYGGAVFANSAMQTQAQLRSDEDSAAEITISGLNNSLTYDITFGGLAGITTRPTVLTHGAASTSIIGSGTDAERVGTLTGRSPSSGSIVIGVTQGAGAETISVLSAIKIVENASSAPTISSGTQSPENQFTAYRSTNLKGGLQ